jgi:cysteine synthase
MSTWVEGLSYWIASIAAQIAITKLLNKEKIHKESVSLNTYESLVGNTPIVQLHTASKLTGCKILLKVINIFYLHSNKILT